MKSSGIFVKELLIPIFLKKALAGEPLTISGDGSQYRKFIYVTDIAQAHLLAMEDCARNETYNLEGQQKVTVLEVAERIRDLIGEHVKITKVPARAGDFGGKDVSAANKDGKGVEIGRGKIDIPRFIRTIATMKYAGMLSLEYEKNAKDPLAGLAESVGYVRGVIAALRA